MTAQEFNNSPAKNGDNTPIIDREEGGNFPTDQIDGGNPGTPSPQGENAGGDSQDVDMPDVSTKGKEKADGGKNSKVVAAAAEGDVLAQLQRKRDILSDDITEQVLTADPTDVLVNKKIEDMQARLKLIDNHIHSLMKKGESASKAGIKLSKGDLPKFYLKTDHDASYNGEKFDNVEHFLRTFEKVLYSANEDIQRDWFRFISLTLPYDYDAWLQTDLKGCKRWDEARALFTTKFGKSSSKEEAIRRIYNSFMKSTDSILDYTNRFLKLIHEAGRVKTDPHMAEKYRTSLYEPCQVMLLTVLESRSPNGKDWTIDEICKIARNLFGDVAIREKCGDAGHKRKSSDDHGAGDGGSRKKAAAGAGSSKKGGASGGFFCPRHGGAASNHDAANCFSLGSSVPGSSVGPSNPKFLGKKNVPYAATNNRPCRYCHKTWTHGHKCKEFYEAKDKQKEDVTVLAIRADTDDTQEEEVDPVNIREAMEEDDPYHCKYDDSMIVHAQFSHIRQERYTNRKPWKRRCDSKENILEDRTFWGN
jgi:hypothetical protein